MSNDDNQIRIRINEVCDLLVEELMLIQVLPSFVSPSTQAYLPEILANSWPAFVYDNMISNKKRK